MGSSGDQCGQEEGYEEVKLQHSSVGQESGVQKKKSKKAKGSSLVSPECIAEKRRQREEKRNKRQEAVANGQDQEGLPILLQFRKRELALIPDVTSDSFRAKVKVMSYNILAQCLIRRELFPTNGSALKWATRSKVLLNEIKYYEPDILCLQEVDAHQYDTFWKDALYKVGLETKYLKSEAKNHGLVIAFSGNFFFATNQWTISFDREADDEVERVADTQNVGFFLSLKFSANFRQKYPSLSKEGVIIGTSHLFWHPFGTYERTRQTYIVLRKYKEFVHCLNALNPQSTGWYSLFAGDFNSQPYHPPYLSLVSKPVTYNLQNRYILGAAIEYFERLSRYRNSNQQVLREDEEENEMTKSPENQEEHLETTPSTFDISPKQEQMIKKLEVSHNSIGFRMISLYSLGYKTVHPENAGLDNERNEPVFSNWAHSWRGLLDYIFIISDWDKVSDQSKIDTLEEVTSNQGIKLLRLLKLPLPSEMGEEPSGQPRIGQFPSDHLSLMAELELC